MFQRQFLSCGMPVFLQKSSVAARVEVYLSCKNVSLSNMLHQIQLVLIRAS